MAMATVGEESMGRGSIGSGAQAGHGHAPCVSLPPSPRTVYISYTLLHPNNNLQRHRHRHRTPLPTARSYTNTVTPHLAFGPLPDGRAKPQDPLLHHSTGWEGACIRGHTILPSSARHSTTPAQERALR